MDERVVQFRVGVVVLATIMIAVILTLQFGKTPTFMRPTYTIYIRFPDAPGVSEGTPIRKSGIVIGEVAGVRFADDGNGVVVTADIYSDRKIPRTDVCRISTSLLGDAALEFVSPGNWQQRESAAPSHNDNAPAPRASSRKTGVYPASFLEPVFGAAAGPAPGTAAAPAAKGPAPEKKGESRFLEPNDTIVGVVSPDAVQVIANLQDNLSKAIGSVAKTSDDLGGLVRQVGNLLNANEDRINRILAQTDKTTAMFQETLDNINKIVGDPQMREQLHAAIKEAPLLLKDTRETVNKMGETMVLLNKNLENIADFTGPLGERGPILMNRLDKGAEKLDQLMGELLVFSQSLNNPNGTVGRLINDPQLYENIACAIQNVEELTVKLRPIIDDARVFSDKIARHPEVLGVRGAVQRNPGIK